VSRGPGGRLGASDFRAVLDFLSDTRDLDLETPYSPSFVGHLDVLVGGGAHPLYRENDLAGRRTPLMVDADGMQVDDADELYWAVGPCAITQYRSATGDMSSARLTDVMSVRRYRESRVYREYFAPGGVGYMLDLGLSARRGWQRTLLFCKAREEKDFSERDRDVLELLRPHLQAREARAELHLRLSGDDGAGADPPGDSTLTLREREIVYLVGQGKTNAEIAVELWITPGTVKKHLEHVYEKLGVSGRAAAAGGLRGSSPDRAAAVGAR
jgi:DNA-binding CsgD family transcriptional regulator